MNDEERLYSGRKMSQYLGLACNISPMPGSKQTNSNQAEGPSHHQT